MINKNKDIEKMEAQDKEDELLLENEKGMDVTLKDYYINSSLFNVPKYQLDFIKNGLSQKLNMIINKNGKVKINIAKYGAGYLFHVIIPSETVNKLKYDVVISLTPPDDEETKNLNNYNIKLFSNSPSFAYGYAYALSHSNLYIDDFRDKLEDMFFSKPPVDRNPGLSLGYEKFTFMALKYLDNNDYFNKSKLEKFNDFVSVKEIHSVIPDLETKLKEYHMLKASMTEREKFIKRKTTGKSSATRSKSTTLDSKKVSHTGIVHSRDKSGKIVPKSKTGTSKTKITPKRKISAKSKKKI